MSATTTTERFLTTKDGCLYVKKWVPYSAHINAKSPIVLFHDSLGCVELWRNFPERLAMLTSREVIAYDRIGFGRSDPYPGTLDYDFVFKEARTGFAEVINQLDLQGFVCFGHSVGGGMAVVSAATYPEQCIGLITESAQSFVEDRTLEGIREAKHAFSNSGQLDRLRKYHGHKAEWVLQAWIDTWLSDQFRNWTLREVLPDVKCPVLAIHGSDDEYGSTAHPSMITELAAGPTSMEIIPNCGHVPHKEDMPRVLESVSGFMEGAM